MRIEDVPTDLEGSAGAMIVTREEGDLYVKESRKEVLKKLGQFQTAADIPQTQRIGVLLPTGPF